MTPEVFGRFEVEAKRRMLRPSDLMRIAIERFLEFTDGENESAYRHHQISEFSQIALDKIITEQYPQYREQILAETNRRMEKYHAR
ncbi:hypothetical protein [Sphingomonas sp. Leaf25]|uniref:hypothetical protein n=1 Tax=Sphingomonas sp. Leaf25 TaxID=1735692 RepID=UPI00190FD0A7|nr:hypothetical protein [Sphingomonas sp. Leaf25]